MVIQYLPLNRKGQKKETGKLICFLSGYLNKSRQGFFLLFVFYYLSLYSSEIFHPYFSCKYNFFQNKQT